MRQKIHVLVERADGSREEREVAWPHVTAEMSHAADDLLHTLATGDRPLVTNLYDLCALAFGTTRDEAKQRLTAAAYGKPGKTLP